MKAEEKATELINKYLAEFGVITLEVDAQIYLSKNKLDRAKQCALICVDEIIKVMKPICSDYNFNSGYWQEVKQQLKKY